ncbi:MAG: UMP kinase, partial [Elusimicrobiota bacterium]
MRYKRVLIKLSGQMLGDKGKGFSVKNAAWTAKEIKSIADQGMEIAVLVGGGNMVRARDIADIDRLAADFMGMTATIINSLGLKSVLENIGINAKVMSAVNLEGITERHVVDRARDYLAKGKVVIFAGGTGAPYVTTDTAAALRALEIGAEIILKAT